MSVPPGTLRAGGTWTTIRSINQVLDIACYGDKVWCGTFYGGIACWNTSGELEAVYTTDNGLPDNYVDSIAITPDGKVWCLCPQGLCRFDGNIWTVHVPEIENSVTVITCLAAAPDNSVWCGTRNGLVQFDGEEWQAFTDAYGLPISNIRHIKVTESGVVWFATNEELFSFDGLTSQVYHPGEHLSEVYINGFCVCHDGTILCNMGWSVWSYDGDEWSQFDMQFFFDRSSEPNPCDIIQAPDGSLWFGSRTDGLFKFDGESWSWITNENFERNGVGTFTISSNGEVWCGLNYMGLYRYNGISWMSCIHGLPDNNVGSATVGPDGSMWFGTTRNGGIARFDGTNWTRYPLPWGLPENYVSSFGLVEDLDFGPDGELWISAPGGILRYENDSWTAYTLELDYISDVRGKHSLAPDGTLWTFNRWQGLLRFDGEKWEVITELCGYDVMDVETLDVAPDGTVLIGTMDYGVVVYDGDQAWLYTTEDGLPSNHVFDIACSPDGSYWFQTSSALTRFDGSTWITFTNEDDLLPGGVGNLEIMDNGDVWCVIREFGVCRFNGTSWESYTLQDGLVSTWVHDFARDRDGKVYICTDHGISVFTPSPDDTAVESKTDLQHPLPVIYSYPNPFNASVVIDFTLPEGGFVELVVYNVSGQRIRSLVSGDMTAGRYTVRWDGRDCRGSDVSSGVYLAGLRANGRYSVRRMTLLR